jgi:hypothetical protein
MPLRINVVESGSRIANVRTLDGINMRWREIQKDMNAQRGTCEEQAALGKATGGYGRRLRAQSQTAQTAAASMSTWPDAAPNKTHMPRFLKQARERSNVSLPTPSKTA